MRTRLTGRFGIEKPIIQGGLAHLAFAGLAAAVCRAGGLGQITAASLCDGEALRQEIRLLRSLTDRPYAVNFALGHRDLSPYLDIALEEGAPIISVTGGNPEPLFKQADASGVKVAKIVLVAGVRQAQKAEGLGADAVVAVGFEGGGHIGRDDIGSMVLIPLVVDSVAIPVVASGGIAGGRGLAAALALGAEGIEMGTRFVATQECIAHANYKRALLAGKETDTVIIERTLGRPGRALRNAMAQHILEAEAAGRPLADILPLISGAANKRAAIDGDMADGFVWAGQAMGLIDDIPTVAALLARTIGDAEEAIAQAARRTRH